MDTNLYFTVRGDFEDIKAKLAAMPREQLEASILDEVYNGFLRQYADYRENETDPHGSGKRLPYIGWFWRHIEFSDLTHIPIGNCGDFIGFMANNKWDYPERCMTEEEARGAIAIIDKAIALSQQGGVMDEILAETKGRLSQLWDYFQTLTVPASTAEVSV